MQDQRLLPVLIWNLMPLLSPKVAGAEAAGVAAGVLAAEEEAEDESDILNVFLWFGGDGDG